MKRLFSFLLVVSLLSVTIVRADDARYVYDRIIVSFSFEYSISINEGEKSGWIAEIMGDSDSLHILFSEAELYGQDSVYPNGVKIIRIKGECGERTFLTNGMTLTDIQTVRLQLWSGITMDGLDVVKDYSKPLEAAYLEFYFSSEKVVSGVGTSFFIEDIDPNNVDSGRAKGEFVQIGNTKNTDFSGVNYTGDLTAFLVNDWEIDWAALSEFPGEELPVDSDEPLDDSDEPQDDVDEPLDDADEPPTDVDEPPADVKEGSIADDRKKVADMLKELKLFLGTTTGYQLDTPLTRAQAATILVRLLGEEANVLQEVYPDNPFSDVQDDHWAKNYILFCYENGITKGTSETTFEPERTIPYKEFLALVMRLMGYDSEPGTSLSDSVSNTLFGSDYAKRLESSSEFVRGDVVDIMDKALKTPLNTDEPTLLAEELIEKEVFTHEQAVKAQLLPDSGEGVIEQINIVASGKLSQ